MKRPNLFVLGAPKCGTTALARWLAAHPDVYVSPVKEPHYFCDEHRRTPTLEAYERLFAGAGPQTPWVCEASVWYLFSPTAVPNILRYSPDARFVVMVREPTSMAASMHEQHRFNGNELVDDLEAALALNDTRRDGAHDGIRAAYEPAVHLAYYETCALGAQLERLFALVPRDRVHVIVFDDLQRDPVGVHAGVLRFLDLPPTAPPSLERVNAAKERRHPWLDALVLRAAGVKNRLGITRRLGLLAALRRRNVRYRERAAIPASLVATMRDRFANDTVILSRMLERDLVAEWDTRAEPEA